MLFNIDQDQGTWFEFQESTVDAEGVVTFLPAKEGAGRMCIRQADAEFFDALYKKTRKRVVEVRPNPANRNKLERLDEMDIIAGKEAEEREALIDYWIVDFADFKGPDRRPIPCTKENKVKLMKLGAVRRFVDECHRRITSDGGLIKEQAENL